jgi:phosphopantetheine adenylyltransferase
MQGIHIKSRLQKSVKTFFCISSSALRYIASTTEAWELSGLAYKVSNIHSHLVKQLTLCFQHIGESVSCPLK